jgi:hypothetical protein
MPEIGIGGKLLAGGVLGIGLIFYIIWSLKRGEQDRQKLGGNEAWTKGKAEADDAQRKADDAAKAAKDEAGTNPTDW